MLPAEELLGLQNPDGGWGYAPFGRRTVSCTEPTCYSLLALAAGGQEGSGSTVHGAQWLARCQRADGGFAPRESVRESSWLTALALLLPAGLSGPVDRPEAETWLLEQSGRESSWMNRVRLLLTGIRSDVSLAYDGWPWYPGTAAWVTPTALSILALERIARSAPQDEVLMKQVRARINQGRAFLLVRRCRDGGWNHGSTTALGYDSDSYPETTGVALLALNGVSGAGIERGIMRGERHLSDCKSREAGSWLTLGLLAHNRTPARPDPKPHGGTLETALGMLADAALKGRNPLLA